ncbi:MAG: ATP-binding protein [Methanomassiliicoccaceae archaeon]|nr:ATP-binding protein [Methanomassiliicoccaceae archaeon]
MSDIERTAYRERISGFIGNRNAKVVTGIRRCGKSTFVRNLSETMRASDEFNSIYIDMELWDNRELKDPDKLYRKIKSSLVEDKKNLLFLDEVQDVPEWESVVRSLISENVCDIYITGSNSKMLASEYATYLSGRLNTLEMFPLTLRECKKFNDAYGTPSTDQELLDKFIRVGGFPIIWCGSYNDDTSHLMLQDILSTIMMKDIIARYKVANPDLLDRIFRFICGNLGKYTSLNNIYNVLRSEDKNVSRNTVYAYAGHLESSYLIQKANVYNIKGKRVLSAKYKYFLTDIGLKHVVLGYKADDIPGHMENIVYLDLRSRGYKVWVGDNNGKEIDLVAEKHGKKVYVQTTFRFTSEDVLKREFGNLKGIDDNHPKYVVSMDSDIFHGDVDGIISCGLADFLKKEDL